MERVLSRRLALRSGEAVFPAARPSCSAGPENHRMPISFAICLLRVIPFESWTEVRLSESSGEQGPLMSHSDPTIFLDLRGFRRCGCFLSAEKAADFVRRQVVRVTSVEEKVQSCDHVHH